ncbi:MAG: hypothetical protein GF409_08845 [Candidatus Omnitrophica bacterium]|nr:hypothetical protein [Candidatus Omnitrophota bacterium]
MDEKQKEEALIHQERKAEEAGALEWYFRPWVIALAIFVAGPLGLLPLWFRPRTNLYIKIGVSVVVILFTIWLVQGSMTYYREMIEHINEISEAVEQS